MRYVPPSPDTSMSASYRTDRFSSVRTSSLGPSAIFSPSFIIITRFTHEGMSSSSWVIMTILTPSDASMSNILLNRSFMTMSNPVIGSSRTSKPGLDANALAMRALLISPRERFSIVRSRMSSIPSLEADSNTAFVISMVTSWFLNTSMLPKKPERITSDTVVDGENLFWRSMETTPILFLRSKMLHLSRPNSLNAIFPDSS